MHVNPDGSFWGPIPAAVFTTIAFFFLLMTMKVFRSENKRLGWTYVMVVIAMAILAWKALYP